MSSCLKHSRNALTVFSAVMLLAGAASATDYDPPIFVDEAPEFVPVEIGSGWYLRGDIAYNFEKPFRDFAVALDPAVSYDEFHSALAGGVGFGYHFTDFLRADLTLSFLSKNSFTAGYNDGVNAAAASGSSRVWSGMANVYADLGTVAGITPYVGAGIGTVYTSRRFDLVAAGPAVGAPIDLTDSKNEFTLAYSLSAGIAYKLTNNVSLDLGYQYLNAPNAEYVAAEDFVTYPVRRGMDFHQVKVGLRYDLW